jgi:hypothetical protein
MASRDTLLDGTYIAASEVGSPRYKFPFRQSGDNISSLFEQDYWQSMDAFMPYTLGTANTKAPGFYLVDESDPVPLLANLVKLTRTWARIPASQSVDSTLSVTKPQAVAVNALNRSGVNNWALNSTAYTAGNYLIVGSSVHGPFKVCTSATTVAPTTRITVPAGHGLSGSETIYFNGSSTNSVPNYFRALTGEYTVVNSTQIDVDANLGSAITRLYVYLVTRAYTSGLKRVRCRNVTTFYMPGITPGISSADDITIPSGIIDENGLLDAIFQIGSGYVTYDVRSFEPWLWPIYKMQTTQINLADL